MDNSNPPTNLDDTSLVAFLALKGHAIVPQISRESPELRVSFDITGDDQQIEKDIESFYHNEQVGVFDFVRKLKEVKSQMHNLKRVGRK